MDALERLEGLVASAVEAETIAAVADLRAVCEELRRRLAEEAQEKAEAARVYSPPPPPPAPAPPKRPEEIEDEKLVRRLAAIEDRLTEWEIEFVESVARRVLDEHKLLTPKQRETAERIYEEKG